MVVCQKTFTPEGPEVKYVRSASVVWRNSINGADVDDSLKVREVELDSNMNDDRSEHVRCRRDDRDDMDDEEDKEDKDDDGQPG